MAPRSRHRLTRYAFVWGNAIKTSKSRMEEQLKELCAYAEKIAADELKDEAPESFAPVSSDQVRDTIQKIDQALEGRDFKKKRQQINYAKKHGQPIWRGTLSKCEYHYLVTRVTQTLLDQKKAYLN